MEAIMLTPVKLVDQWSAIERDLPGSWAEVRLRLRTEIPSELPEAARVLGSMGAGRIADGLALTVQRAGGAAGPEAARRLFAYLDERRVWCLLEQAAVTEAATPAMEVVPEAPSSLTAAWDAAVATLPVDWSDLLCSLELESSAQLDRAVLLCAPLNPARQSDAATFTFRAARLAGYGASPAMVRRCFERLDAEELRGRVTVLRHLSESDPVGTQGPVWLVGGRAL
jgi:hypothetical protein